MERQGSDSNKNSPSRFTGGSFFYKIKARIILGQPLLFMSQKNSVIFTLALVFLIGGFIYLMIRQMSASLNQVSPQSALENLPNPTASAVSPTESAAPSVASSPAAQPTSAAPNAQSSTVTPTPPSTTSPTTAASAATPTPPTSQGAIADSNPSKPAATSSTPDTSSWQIWKSASLGAEMKYPPDWNVSESGRDVTMTNTKDNVSWKMRFYTNSNKSVFQTWYASYFPTKDNNACNFGTGTLKVGTLTTEKVTLNSTSTAVVAGSSPNCDAAGDYAISADQSQIVRIYTAKASSDMTTVSQMLGTFQFKSGTNTE